MTAPYLTPPDATFVPRPAPPQLPQPILRAVQALAASRFRPASPLDARAMETGGSIGVEGYDIRKILYDLAHARGAFQPSRPAGALADFLEVPGLVRGATAMYDLTREGHPVAGAMVGMASVVPGAGGAARGAARGAVREAGQVAARDLLTGTARAGENALMGNARQAKNFEAWYADYLSRLNRDVSREGYAEASQLALRRPGATPLGEEIRLPSGKRVTGALSPHQGMRDAGFMVEEAPNYLRRPTDDEWRYIRAHPAYQTASALADETHAAHQSTVRAAQERTKAIESQSQTYDAELRQAVEAAGEPIYVRFGAPPEGGRSMNTRENIREAGVSVYPAYRVGDRVFLDLHGIDPLTASSVMNRPDIYEIFGKAVDLGGDNEPVVAMTRASKLPSGTQVGTFRAPPASGAATDAASLYKKFGITPPGER